MIYGNNMGPLFCAIGIESTLIAGHCFHTLTRYACLSACQYDLVGPEGIVESHQITRDGKASAAEAVDCKWYIRAPPRSKVSHINLPPPQSSLQTNFKMQLKAKWNWKCAPGGQVVAVIIT